VIVAVGAGIAAYLSRRKGEGSEDLSLTTGLDERDIAILKALSSGEKSVSDLSRDLNLNKSVVWRRVKRLKDLGLLNMRVEKGKTLYSLTDSGREALRSHGSSAGGGS
jgi:predicted transcriptional regulator